MSNESAPVTNQASPVKELDPSPEEPGSVMATNGSGKPSRAKLRAKIFSYRPPKKKIITFFDALIEIRQPLLGDIVRAQENEDREAAVIETLVRYSYIPGTDERIFEESDSESLKSMPFGGDFLAVTQAFAELTEVNFLGQRATSEPTKSPTSSSE
jgi:hypothetical protein